MFTAINRKAKRWVIRQIKRRPVVLISDTTLRDGAQMPGIHLHEGGKLEIAAALADAGVHSIDLGFPASGPAEVKVIQRIAATVKGPILSALARTKRSDIDCAAEALAEGAVYKKAVTLFIGTSPMHRKHKHEMTKAQVIATAVDSVAYATESFEVISFGAEDASRTEPEFLHEIYEKVIEAGATSIGFTDTVGILTPRKASDAVTRIAQSVPSIDSALLGVHFHNDLGLATANSLAAVAAGANIVQGTVNGIGERAGNVAIEEVVLALTLHRDEFGRSVHVRPQALSSLSEMVARHTGIAPAADKPAVGANIFRTEAGIHQDGLLKHPETYLPYQPELVGAGPIELVLGPSSGKSAVRHHLENNGIKATDDLVGRLVARLKSGIANPDDEELTEVMGVLKDHLTLSVGEEIAAAASQSTVSD